MAPFFLLIEVLRFFFALYLFLKKEELAVVYLPILFFSHSIIDPVFSAVANYAMMTFLILALLFKNPSYYNKNIFSFILFLYFIALLPRSEDLVFIRPYIFGVLWLFTVIPLISSIYQKYSREVIIQELAKSSSILLLLFVANVAVSTLKGFSPNEMYGITKGILYGNIYGAGFNVLPIALFISTLSFLEHKKVVHFIIAFISFCLVMVSLRRSVMGLSAIGVAMAYFTMLTRERAKMFFLMGSVTVMMGFAIYMTTDLANIFKDRYELRKLDERELEEESRFLEYQLVYKDMFVYHDYSPLVGFEPFNSWGNYGKGFFEDRSLHGDITNIAHSSGLIGVFLYLLMIFSAFRRSLRHSLTRSDYLIVAFCGLTLFVYTLTGRFTEVGAMIMLYLVLAIPQAQPDPVAEEDGEVSKAEASEKALEANQQLSLKHS